MNDLQRALLTILILDLREQQYFSYSESKPPQGDDPIRHQLVWDYIGRDSSPGQIDAEIDLIYRREEALLAARRRQWEARPPDSPVVVPPSVEAKVTGALNQAHEYLDKFATSTLSKSVVSRVCSARTIIGQFNRADTWTQERQTQVANALSATIEYLASRDAAPTIRDAVIQELHLAQSVLHSAEWVPVNK